MIAILDYGIGNISSIYNMFRKIGIDAEMTGDPAKVRAAEKIILPGVGSFDYCMSSLRKAPFFNDLQEMVLEKKTPVLGVCVGCQMLFEQSEEGNETGLGWMQGSVVKFQVPQNQQLKVPHMGWTDVQVKNDHALYKGIEEPRFYFVHSYHTVPSNTEWLTATANYGCEFTASVAKDNIYGVQFHPEKSHRFGMQLYTNFANLA